MSIQDLIDLLQVIALVSGTLFAYTTVKAGGNMKLGTKEKLDRMDNRINFVSLPVFLFSAGVSFVLYLNALAIVFGMILLLCFCFVGFIFSQIYAIVFDE